MLTIGKGYDSIYLVAARATWNLKTIQKKIAKEAKEKFSERQSRVFEQTERLKELKHKSLILAQDERWRRA